MSRSPTFNKKPESFDDEPKNGDYSYPPEDISAAPPPPRKRDYSNGYSEERDPDSGNSGYSRPYHDDYPPPRSRRRSISPPPRHYDPYYDAPPPRHMGHHRNYLPPHYPPYDDPYHSRGYDRRGYSPYDDPYYRGPYDRPPRGGYRDDYPYGGGYSRGGYYDRDLREDRRPPVPRYRPPPLNDKATEELKAKSTTIWVGNLPYNYREPEVGEMFERFGKLIKITVPIDRYTGKNKGFAFVEFETRKEAEEAYDHFLGTDIEGRRLRVDWDIGLQSKEKIYTEKPE